MKISVTIILLSIFIVISHHLGASDDRRCYRPTGCALPSTLYFPYVQTPSSDLDLWRERLYREESNVQEVLRSNANITCEKVFKKSKSKDIRCFQYAIRKITGFKGYIELPRPDRISIDLDKYFVQVQKPKKNSLLIYTTSQLDLTVHHFAVAINDLYGKSKSGSRPEVTQHLHFHIMSVYGKAMWVYDLRSQYASDKALLLQEMESDLEQARRKRACGGPYFLM